MEPEARSLINLDLVDARSPSRIQSPALGANLNQSGPTLKLGKLLADRSSRPVSPFVSGSRPDPRYFAGIGNILAISSYSVSPPSEIVRQPMSNDLCRTKDEKEHLLAGLLFSTVAAMSFLRFLLIQIRIVSRSHCTRDNINLKLV